MSFANQIASKADRIIRDAGTRAKTNNQIITAREKKKIYIYVRLDYQIFVNNEPVALDNIQKRDHAPLW